MDALLAALAAVTQLILGVMGVYVSLRPPSKPQHRYWMSAFLGIGVLGVVLTGWLAQRSSNAQDKATGKISEAVTQATNANTAATNANNASVASEKETEAASAEARKANESLSNVINQVFDAEAQRQEGVRRENKEYGIEAVFFKHQKLRSDIFRLGQTIHVADRGYSDDEATIRQSHRPGDKQVFLEEARKRYEAKFEKEIEPQLIYLIADVLIQTGENATPDKSNIPRMFGLKAESAATVVQYLETQAAKLIP